VRRVCGSRRVSAPAQALHFRRLRRQYCARRLLRLYQMLGFSHGGGKAKYQNRTLGAADVTDGRCVALPARCAKKLRRLRTRRPQTAAWPADSNPKLCLLALHVLNTSRAAPAGTSSSRWSAPSARGRTRWS
jgi:hypothetical protein